jgi:hypothetical protein
MSWTLRITFLVAALAVTEIVCAGPARQNTVASRVALPPVVVAAEGLSEDIQTDLDTLGWTAASTRLAQLQASRSALRTAVLPDSGTANAASVARYETALDSLTVQIGRRDRLASLESANQMSRVLLAVAAGYALTVPVQVGLLDVAGREAIYRAGAADWQGASAAAAEIRTQYAAVQAHVVVKDAALDGRMARQLTALDAAVSARNAARVRTVATGLLNDVDLVERTY